MVFNTLWETIIIISISPSIKTIQNYCAGSCGRGTLEAPLCNGGPGTLLSLRYVRLGTQDDYILLQIGAPGRQRTARDGDLRR
jgi:hypothetical protein